MARLRRGETQKENTLQRVLILVMTQQGHERKVNVSPKIPPKYVNENIINTY
jgi:hypothetical protein